MTDITIPGYEILEQLGAGTVASVYRARHVSLDKEVAIKVMDPFLNNDPTFNEHFKREAQISAQLQHPHIVQVYDVDSVEGVNYLAMEYVGNGDINDVIHEPLHVDNAYDMVRQISEALDYAHSKGRVHGDIKPGNILIRDNGAYVLADFGIAKVAESNTQMTVTGSVIGTPSYMSPEQAQGLPLDGRSDLYSLAIVCYEMITGDLPYKADSPVGTALKHLLDPIPELPPALAKFQPFFAKALAKNRDERFQTGAEMAVALGVVLDGPKGQPSIAGPGEAPPRMQTAAPNGDRPPPLNAWKVAKASAGAAQPATDSSRSDDNPASEESAIDEPPTYPGEVAAVGIDDAVEAAVVQPPNDSRSQGHEATPAIAPGSTAPPQQPPVAPQPSVDREPLVVGKQGSRAPLWLLAGIAIAAGAGVAAWLAMQDQSSGSEPSIAPSVAPVPGTSNEESETVELLLEKARAASNLGLFFEPAGNSAFDFYQKARALDPDNPSTAAGLDLLLVNTVERAKQHMSRGELDMAQQELGRAALVNPSDSYLMSAREDLANAVNAKLEAPIATQQLHQDSDQAPVETQQLANDDGDTMAQDSEPATELTTSSPAAMESAETTPQTRSIPKLLAQAQADMQRNSADSRDAALAVLQQVQDREPANEDAEAMLRTLLDQYLKIARREAEKGNFQKAKRAMDSARSINPDAQPGSTIGGVAELLATGVSHEEQGEYQAAVKTYLEALLIDPDSADIDASLHRVHQSYVDAIQQYIANGEQGQAAALRTEALTWFPNSELLQSPVSQANTSVSPGGERRARPAPALHAWACCCTRWKTVCKTRIRWQWCGSWETLSSRWKSSFLRCLTSPDWMRVSLRSTGMCSQWSRYWSACKTNFCLGTIPQAAL